MRRISLCVVLALVSACGTPKDPNKDGIAGGVQTPNNVTLVAPSHPRGTVSGQILTAELTPLGAATVSVNVGESATDVGGSWTATTDTNGNFAITGVPAGAQVIVTASESPSYATVRVTTAIPGSVGNFPIDNGNAAVGPLALTSLAGTLKVLVLDHNAVPVNGVKVTLEANPAGTDLSGGGAYGTPMGTVVVQATADANGNVSFTGIPTSDELSRLNGQYTVTVPAVLDTNGNPSSGGKVATYSGRSVLLDPSVRVIQLPDARATGTFGIIASNVQSIATPPLGAPLNNLLRSADPIYLVFSQAVAQASFSATLTDEYGKNPIAVTPTFTENNNMVTLAPGAQFLVGQEYNLAVRATSLDNGSSVYARGYFFGGDPTAPQSVLFASTNAVAWIPEAPPAPQGVLNPLGQVLVNFNEPLGAVGAPSAPAVFFDKDLDNSGTIGDSVGEHGFATGFPLTSDEPTFDPGALFPLVPSGYTTRWAFTYNPAPSKVLGGSQTVNAGVKVTIAFSGIVNAVGGYQNVWGQQVTQDMSQPIVQFQ